MNDVQNIIDRQLGIFCRFNYDNILKRLVVNYEESFYGALSAEQDPPIFACRFAEAGGYEHILALANEDGRVVIQDTSSTRAASCLDGFQCHNNAVFDLAWAPSHMSFVTVSGDHTASLWDLAEGAPKRVLVFSNHTRSVKTAVFPPGTPSVFATGARDGHILLWDIRTNNQPNVILKPDNCLMNCHSSFTPKTPGSHGKRNRLDTNRAISITGLVFQDDLTLLSCGECDGNIKVWDLRKNYNIYKREPLPKHSIPYCGNSAKNGYTNLVIDESRVRLYASCMDNVIYCFNVATYSAVPEQRYSGHENGTFYIKAGLSPDGLYLVSGSSDTHAYIWNVKCSEPVVKLAGHRAEVTCAAWCQRGDTKIVTCSDDARHKIWRIGPEFLPEFPPDRPDLGGRAELVPRTDLATLPKWGPGDRTPSSLKRKHVATPGSSSSAAKRPHRPPADLPRRTKRCLTDLMNGSKRSETEEAEVLVKRLRLDASARPDAGDRQSSPTPRAGDPLEPHWSYLPPAPGTSFMTPTKNYQAKRSRVPSPEMSDTHECTSPPRRFAERTSPAKLRIITFTTPTKNLPDFVASGEAPHLRLMSPAKKRRVTTDLHHLDCCRLAFI
ncbi:hypothetical protein RR48_11321 [Papilio machaon]|uniref:Uncharacterized protein n=1 Tax=Papilio machaon TaxID=76193 RepID=A0A194QMS3_PAPMA|nr:hypothetical protein RR48_11321 [Papilio machaon]